MPPPPEPRPASAGPAPAEPRPAEPGPAEPDEDALRTLAVRSLAAVRGELAEGEDRSTRRVAAVIRAIASAGDSERGSR